MSSESICTTRRRWTIHTSHVAACSLGCDDDAFEAMYHDTPGASGLLIAIRANAAKEGHIKQRKSKNGCPEECRSRHSLSNLVIESLQVATQELGKR